ncbi:MAG: hypothetical protein ACOY94_26990 [Bacillota bacterium]
MAQYSVQQVVATGCTDALVAFRLPLPTPVWEVTAIQKTVLVDRATVTLGSVLLRGRLRACYSAAGAPEGTRPPPVGAPLPGTGLSVMQAPLQAVWAEAPFSLAISLPAAEPGQELTVTAAHVTDQSVHIAQQDAGGLILALDDQSVLHLAVRLSRTRDLQPASQRPENSATKPPTPAKRPPSSAPRAAGIARFASKPRR